MSKRIYSSKCNSGERYNCLVIVSRIYGKKNGPWFQCKCDCGKVWAVRQDRILDGTTKSCGCKRLRIGKTHGFCRSTQTKIVQKLYRAWSSMLSRCRSKNNRSWSNYGGRGISVCERWSGDDGFVNFYSDMGCPTSTSLSLDRIDNNGNYEQINCRWATRSQQQKNKRPLK